ncbi:uncharacterized protein BDV14DRAFT_211945 [Aspergillus stella-maris]|uniref:uncharacterized protein n=1 Tax=Aspergillus stella-maris TaxID=1810926 RepID=UPI003CCE4EE9
MSAITLASLGLSIISSAAESCRLFGVYRHYYGPLGGTLLQLFGSSTVWKTQLQVLSSDEGDKDTARDFRDAGQQESNMVAIAGTILAQIAITAFELSDIQSVHWTARGCFAVSLVSSIISVYYASKQHKILGRCLGAPDIKKWIRGKPLSAFTSSRKNTHSSSTSNLTGTLELQPDDNPEADGQVQLPSIAAVLTISAPVFLLSTAVYAFLSGLGVYLGFVWKSNLGSSSQGDNLAIFITYIVALMVCHTLYALSRVVAGEQVDDGEIGGLLERMQDEEVMVSAKGLSGAEGVSELQMAFREAARLRREMAVVDGRIAVLLEGVGNL